MASPEPWCGWSKNVYLKTIWQFISEALKVENNAQTQTKQKAIKTKDERQKDPSFRFTLLRAKPNTTALQSTKRFNAYFVGLAASVLFCFVSWFCSGLKRPVVDPHQGSKTDAFEHGSLPKFAGPVIAVRNCLFFSVHSPFHTVCVRTGVLAFSRR